MSGLVHILSNTPPGCLLTERKSSCVSHVDHIQISWHSLESLRNHVCNLRTSTICAAEFNNQGKKQSGGFSGGRNRQPNEENESFDNMDLQNHKNGQVPSSFSNPKYRSVATPGKREKEIVELFKKVQAQLRERAAVKEKEKKTESSQVQGEKGTIDSLLKLLRKHSVDKGKETGEEYNVEQSKLSSPFEEEQNSEFFETGGLENEEDIHDNIPMTPTRPASNFRRKYFAPRVKYQPIHSEEETASDSSLQPTLTKITKHKKTSGSEVEPDEPIFFDEREDEFDDDLSEPSDFDDVEKEVAKPLVTVRPNLNSMKVSELRELAKSRGVKRYSKMKKEELVLMLAED